MEWGLGSHEVETSLWRAVVTVLVCPAVCIPGLSFWFQSQAGIQFLETSNLRETGTDGCVGVGSWESIFIGF